MNTIKIYCSHVFYKKFIFFVKKCFLLQKNPAYYIYTKITKIHRNTISGGRNMQDTKTKADINLIQFHKITSRHVLVLEADVDERDRRKLIHISNIIRIAGNELTAIMKKNYEQLTRTKKYRCLQDMYAKAKKADNKEQMKTIASDMNEMQKSYNLTCCLLYKSDAADE